MLLRNKLILLTAVAMVLMLAVLTAVQMRQGHRVIVQAAEERVARHIDAAWQMLDLTRTELEAVADLADPDALGGVRDSYGLDVLAAVDPARSEAGTVAAAVLRGCEGVVAGTSSGFMAVGPDDLTHERPELLERCRIDGKPAASMVLYAASRRRDGRCVVAAQVLTRSDDLLWRVQRGLFGEEFYDGSRVGTVTLFTGPRRTSTTVLKADHTSAVGTYVSGEVARRVLEEERSWIGPAVVVGTRYLSRYDPIRDGDGDVIGMLYIGELESRLLDRKHRTVLLGVGSIAAILLLAGLVAVLLVRLERRAEAQRRRVRFEFLRVLGHELKAPINAVEGYLRLLDQETLGALPDGYGAMVDRSVARIGQMRKLIADLLDLTRIEAGEKRRELVDGVDLAAVLRESAETVEPDADARGVTVTVDAPDGLPMRADRGELSIICNNLMTNAVKYNRDGGAVTARLARENGRIVLAVEDTGIGMTAEEVARLFEEFVRIKNEKTKNILGTGLGLSILKKIAGLYGGEVTVSSEPDVGSTFTVSLIDAE